MGDSHIRRKKDALSLEESLKESMPELWRDGLVDDKLLRAVVRVAMKQELTRRQRECIELYFGERMTMEQIGEQLGVGKSTVYKHIELGKANIQRVLAYARIFRMAMDEADD